MRQELRATMAPDSAPARLTTNIYETAGGEAYVLEVAVPGLENDEIVIEADPYSVVVRTEPRQEQSNDGRKYLQREQSSSPVSRVFDFPVEIDTDNIEAALNNGILRIRVPKAAAARRKVIRVASPGRPASQEGGVR
jgi:HSP20 family protein